MDCHFCLQKWQAKPNSLILLTLTVTFSFFLLREGVQNMEDGRTPKNSNGPSLQLTTGYSWTAGPGQEKQTKEEAKNNHESSSKISY